MMLERSRARYEALRRAAQGPVYVGSGYGQIFEETLKLLQEDCIRYSSPGVAMITDKGREEFVKGPPPRNYCIDCGLGLSVPGGECSKCKKGPQP